MFHILVAEQNKVAKYKNHHFIETKLTMLFLVNLPYSL